MSRRKHVLLQTLQAEAAPPAEGQHIVRALGSRGGNLVEVEFPGGRRTLALLPARFHKKLWIRRGAFVVVDEAEAAGADDAAVTGVIAAVLYADHVKQLRRMPGVWPPEFDDEEAGAGDAAAGGGGGGDLAASLGGLRLERAGGSDSDSSDGGLPPLEPNTNRRVFAYDDDDDDDDSDDGDAEGAEAEDAEGAAAASRHGAQPAGSGRAAGS